MSDPRETLNRIRKQANAATPGPWEVEPFTWRPEHPLPESEWLGVEATGPVKGGVALILLNDDEDDHDAEFIAAARTTVPALRDALEKVLELHPREGVMSVDPEHGPIEDEAVCAECIVNYEPAPWPCPTVEAITTALGGIA